MSVKKYLDKLEDLTGRKIIVTGGTSGIGLSIVKELLYKNANVVILARNLNKANEVKSKLEIDYPNRLIDIVRYDQSDEQSIIDACQTILKDHHDFYALIMNAGIMQPKENLGYVNDIPLTIKTNYVGLNVLLDHLLPHLKEEHRFIFQGSLVANWRCKNVTSLKDNSLAPFKQYVFSKKCIEALYYHYSKIEQNQFSFHLVEPGITNSEIIRDYPAFLRVGGHIFLKIVSHSPEKAALTALVAIQSTTPHNSFIIPRFNYRGYPKIKEFPKKRQREDLYDLLGQI